jgi:hypothetical protein
LTVTVKLACAVLALVSLAEQLTVVAPGRNKLPEPGMQATDTGPSTSSVAVTSNRIRAPRFACARTATFRIPFSLGGVVSNV